LSTGLGTGLRYYFDLESLMIPIFADIRASVKTKNVSPFLSLGFGYTYEVEAANSYKGFAPIIIQSAGVSIKVSDKTALTVGIGYEIQKMKFAYSFTYIDTYHQNSSAISINIGISF